jgi:hypothetical protein
MMSRTLARFALWGYLTVFLAASAPAQDWYIPYRSPCVKREDVFDFAKKPTVKLVAKDRYEIAFAAKGNCDATVSIVDGKGRVVRHLASGVLGANAPAPFKKGSLEQTLYWNGKDDLDLYVKDPESMKVKVSLGLKPTFEKLIADSGPKNLPGYVFSILISSEAAYVCIKGKGGTGHVSVRKFTREGKYIAALTPPPANMPLSKCGGYTQIEYEPGRYALHGYQLNTVYDLGTVIHATPGGSCGGIVSRPALVGNRLFFSNMGPDLRDGGDSTLFYIYTDGSRDVAGMKGQSFLGKMWHNAPRLVASPDGRKLYGTGFAQIGHGRSQRMPFVGVKDVDSAEQMKVFVGHHKKVGSDNAHLSNPVDIDCDAKGNVYVADQTNNRIQVFTPDGMHLRTIGMKTPLRVRVHRKTGDLYVLCRGQHEGRAAPQLVKLSAGNGFKEVFRQKFWCAAVMELDDYSKKPRLWVAGGGGLHPTWGVVLPGSRSRGWLDRSVQIWEERGDTFTKIADFDEDAKKAGGNAHIGRWQGNKVGNGGKLVCDPVRNTLYFDNRMFDLETGEYKGPFSTSPGGRAWNDIAFDKRGFMHIHFHPNHPAPGVGRVDPERAKVVTSAKHGSTTTYEEVPYDYGVENSGWTGALVTRCQGGAKGFQDGMGVNMRGDIAIPSNVYYVPRMDEREAWTSLGFARTANRGERFGSYANWKKKLLEKEKLGTQVYFIRRGPGISLHGGTIWTFNRTGEIRKASAVIAGDLINGTMIDEDLSVYFVNARPRMMGANYFLWGRGSMIGVKDAKPQHPFTGTMIKTKPDTDCRILCDGAAIPLEPRPTRPPDLKNGDYPQNSKPGADLCWVEGAAWLYAGASPIKPVGCECPSQRLHVDWWKRVYVPEAYRHSIGILDTNGNLIMHLGRYGNYDSAAGPKSRIPVGEDGVGVFCPHYISGTDDRLVFSSWGTWITVVKLGYHAENTVPVGRESRPGRE